MGWRSFWLDVLVYLAWIRTWVCLGACVFVCVWKQTRNTGKISWCSLMLCSYFPPLSYVYYSAWYHPSGNIRKNNLIVTRIDYILYILFFSTIYIYIYILFFFPLTWLLSPGIRKGEKIYKRGRQKGKILGLERVWVCVYTQRVPSRIFPVNITSIWYNYIHFL